jgi:hypothetical protein
VVFFKAYFLALVVHTEMKAAGIIRLQKIFMTDMKMLEGVETKFNSIELDNG